MEATIHDESPFEAVESFNKLLESSMLGHVRIVTGAECAGHWIDATWEREPGVDPVINFSISPNWNSETDVLIQPTLTEAMVGLWIKVDAYLQSSDNPRDASGNRKASEVQP